MVEKMHDAQIGADTSLLSSKKHTICIADEVLQIVSDEDSLVLQKAQEMVEYCCNMHALSHIHLLTTEQKKKKFLFAAFSFAIELIKSENSIQRLSTRLDHLEHNESSKTI